ncbi:hypothetical protein NDU88_007499 [Pleurodeles waltl]|uniref:Uncharacterized protein n=1 Tax=Pleurodeles waltl TaxID=8319 RepID=A0AAV7SSX2_PLEWA|nr:hypothetical protein NDU88_007499 [Pleurodeles waltl]
MVPPIQDEREGIRRRRSEEPTGERERKSNGGRRKRKTRKTPGILCKRVDRSRNQDPCGPNSETRTVGPGEPTSEPATLQEKRGQTRPREHDAVKGVVPPVQDEREGIRRRRSEEPTGERKEEQRRTTKEEDTEDAWNPLQESGPGHNQDPCRPNSETRTAGPGEPTSESATLQEKRGQTRYGTPGQGERSGRREEKVKTQGHSTKSTDKGGEVRKQREKI